MTIYDSLCTYNIYHEKMFKCTSPANAGDTGLISVEKIPWNRKQQPTPVFLPGKFHRQRSLAGCSPWGHKQLDMTEQYIY